MPYPDNYRSNTAPDGYPRPQTAEERAEEETQERRERVGEAFVAFLTLHMITERVGRSGPDIEEFEEDLAWLIDNEITRDAYGELKQQREASALRVAAE